MPLATGDQMRCESCGHVSVQTTERCPSCGATSVAAAPPHAGESAALRELAARVEARRGTIGGEPQAAGFAIRLLAFLIDGGILGLFTLPLALAGLTGVKLGLIALRAPAAADTETVLAELLYFAWPAMALVYFTVLHAGAGQTIGKAAVGIAVRTARDLRAIGVVRSCVRALGYLASSSFLGLGFWMIALTPRKRGWHDLLAGTCVVRLAPIEA